MTISRVGAPEPDHVPIDLTVLSDLAMLAERTAQVGRELGGVGLDMRGQAVAFEQAGYSLLGPLAAGRAVRRHRESS
jgi:hypothetical protein